MPTLNSTPPKRTTTAAPILTSMKTSPRRSNGRYAGRNLVRAAYKHDQADRYEQEHDNAPIIVSLPLPPVRAVDLTPVLPLRRASQPLSLFTTSDPGPD
jgi:hypothetical protein